MCGRSEWGSTFQLSARRARRNRPEVAEPVCGDCRALPGDLTPAERETYLRWWENNFRPRSWTRSGAISASLEPVRTKRCADCLCDPATRL